MTWTIIVSHTTFLNPRKEGSGNLTYSELFQRPDLVASNQYWDLNLLLSNALLAACAYIAGLHVLLLSVTFFFIIIAFRANNSLYARSPWGVWCARLEQSLTIKLSSVQAGTRWQNECHVTFTCGSCATTLHAIQYTIQVDPLYSNLRKLVKVVTFKSAHGHAHSRSVWM